MSSGNVADHFDTTTTHLLGAAARAGLELALETRHAKAGIPEVTGCREPVDPSAYDDHVASALGPILVIWAGSI